jgi:hypothetical protein
MVIQGRVPMPIHAAEQHEASRKKHFMTTIRTSCPICGDVELAPSDLSLQLEAVTGVGTYHFECPHCEQVQARPANHRVVSILLATGVAYEVCEDEPITESEIDEFVSQLEGGDWREYLRS